MTFMAAAPSEVSPGVSNQLREYQRDAWRRDVRTTRHVGSGGGELRRGRSRAGLVSLRALQPGEVN